MSKLVYNGLGLGAVGIASFFWGRSSSSSGNSVITPPPSPVGVPEGKNGRAVAGTFDPNSIRPEDFYKFGFPGPIHDLEKRDEFVSCWDRRTRNPYWVVEHITKDLIKSVEGVERKKSVFKEDEQIPPNFRSRLRDYFRSGYDRGHNAPAADAKFNQRALDETFYMTNISPQVGDGFNRDYWAHFEEFARTLTKKYDNVRIMTGSLFLPKPSPENPNRYKVEYEVIGSPPNVAVPTHFFKLIVGENNGSKDIAVGAFVLPNDKIDNSVPLTSFQVPVEALERASGLELLYKVPYYQKKDLCREVKCEVIVRDFSKLPEKTPLALPSK